MFIVKKKKKRIRVTRDRDCKRRRSNNSESVVRSFLFVQNLFSLFRRKLRDKYTNKSCTAELLPIHTGGHEGDCPEQVLSNELCSLLVNSLLFIYFLLFYLLIIRFFLFSRLSWSEQPPRGPSYCVLLLLASQSSEQRTSLFVFFPMWYNWYNSSV